MIRAVPAERKPIDFCCPACGVPVAVGPVVRVGRNITREPGDCPSCGCHWQRTITIMAQPAVRRGAS